MKKKDIYEVTIKILGIVAAYKLIESLIACITVFITYHSISTNTMFDFTGILKPNYSISFILPVVLYGLFGYLFLFLTDKVLSVLRLTDSTEITTQIEKKTIYHIAVLLIGFFLFAYSGNQLTSKTYTNTKATTTQHIEQPASSQNFSADQIKNIVSTSTTTSPTISTTVNYIGILIFLLSIIL